MQCRGMLTERQRVMGWRGQLGAFALARSLFTSFGAYPLLVPALLDSARLDLAAVPCPPFSIADLVPNKKDE